MHQLKKDNVIGRRGAVLALTPHHGDKKVIKALKRAALHDDVWFVRQAAFSQLTYHLDQYDWVRAYKREVHSQPRRTIITEYAKVFPSAAAAFIRASVHSDDSYIVQAEMIRQLGEVGTVDDISLVKLFVKPWSPRKIVRNAANKSINALKAK